MSAKGGNDFSWFFFAFLSIFLDFLGFLTVVGLLCGFSIFPFFQEIFHFLA
jgi:hypothetical protein